ncbi:hypothetical protein M885DRAFT_592189 [Pelagophyceae sp. CCMP2097]|nr:hypothetical protein M885DRAFT_592189 [Pelagophyceae sp. CCMP2097]
MAAGAPSPDVAALLAALSAARPARGLRPPPLLQKRDVRQFRAFYGAFIDAFGAVARLNTADSAWGGVAAGEEAWGDMQRVLNLSHKCGAQVLFETPASRATYALKRLRTRSGYLAKLLVLAQGGAAGALRAWLAAGAADGVGADEDGAGLGMPLRVVAIGGGPAFDAVGLAALTAFGAAAGWGSEVLGPLAHGAEVTVCDIQRGWEPLCADAAAALAVVARHLGAPAVLVSFELCDVVRGLGDDANARVPGDFDMALLSFVIMENAYEARRHNFQFIVDAATGGAAPRAVVVTDAADGLWAEIIDACNAASPHIAATTRVRDDGDDAADGDDADATAGDDADGGGGAPPGKRQGRGRRAPRNGLPRNVLALVRQDGTRPGGPETDQPLQPPSADFAARNLAYRKSNNVERARHINSDA